MLMLQSELDELMADWAELVDEIPGVYRKRRGARTRICREDEPRQSRRLLPLALPFANHGSADKLFHGNGSRARSLY